MTDKQDPRPRAWDVPPGRDGRMVVELDFDGVIHDYTMGWKSPRHIDGPPVQGALDALIRYTQHFDVAIVSARSAYFLARRAMRRWLRGHLVRLRGEAKAAEVLSRIRFPRFKQGGHFGLDDRVQQFKGGFPHIKQITDFEPWQARRR